MSDAKLQSPRGTKDLFGNDLDIFNYIVSKFKDIARLHNAKELATPIFEHIEVFKKSLGETSDIIGKEMYNFLDKGGQEIVLRPEMTAAVVRAVLSEGMFHNLPIKLFGYGPLFRYERPQKGRLRQFHQINMEYVGYNTENSDAELINLANSFINNIGISNYSKLHINSLGDKESRNNYRNALVDYLQQRENELSEDSKIRLKLNPLRILDSKNTSDQQILQDAPKMVDYLNDESKIRFDKLLKLLDSLNIQYNVNDKLVRGLDYYDHTVFEFVTDALGSQGAIIAGGRYNNLYKQMTNHDVSAIGFAGGIERMVELVKIAQSLPESVGKHKIAVIISIGDVDQEILFRISNDLKQSGITTEIAYEQNNIAKKFKFADKISANYAVIIGEDEIKQGKIKIKSLATGAENIVLQNDLVDILGEMA